MQIFTRLHLSITASSHVTNLACQIAVVSILVQLVRCRVLFFITVSLQLGAIQHVHKRVRDLHFVTFFHLAEIRTCSYPARSHWRIVVASPGGR
jgi:hypothetical protein